MTTVRTDRPDLLPEARDAEAMLIGAALLDPSQYDACSMIVGADDFEVALHRLAWQAIGRRRDAAQAVDYALVAADVNATGAFDTAGLVDASLTDCLTLVPNYAHAPEYAKQVAAASTRRKIIAGAANAAMLAHNGGDDADSLVGDVLRIFEELDNRTAYQESGDIRPALGVLESGGLPRGWNSGVSCYDAWTPGLRPQEVHTIAGYTGSGKAQPVSEPVLTPRGWVAIGSLRVGDTVIGANGKATTVTGVFPQGSLDVYRVTFSDRAETRCCADHLWTVQTKHDKSVGNPWRVMTLREIMDGGLFWKEQAKFYAPVCGPVEFDGGDLPIHPYALGVLLGDGHLRGKCEVLLSTADDEVIANTLAVLPGIEARHVSGYDYRLVSPGEKGNWLGAAVRGLGLNGTHSDDKFIPPVYLTASVEDRLSLLRGLMDTDGTACRKTGAMSIATSSRALADGIRELVRSLGGIAKIGCKKTTHLDSWRVSVALPRGVQSFTLSRKASIANTARPKYLPCRALVGADYDGYEECVCISVAAPDCLYVTRDYIVTHNTWMMCQVINSLIDQGARVAVFSLEMPAGAFLPRLLANRAGSAALKWGRPGATFEPGERERIEDAAMILSEATDAGHLSVYFEQTNLAQMSAIVRQRGADAMFVDYMQLMDAPAARMQEYEAITANATGLQRLAKKARCTVVMLSQVNEDHQRSAGASRALGLKGSGAIGAVSDIVLYVQATDEPGIIKLSARKARHGPDANAGSIAEMKMDKASGKLLPKVGVMVGAGAFSDGYIGHAAGVN